MLWRPPYPLKGGHLEQWWVLGKPLGKFSMYSLSWCHSGLCLLPSRKHLIYERLSGSRQIKVVMLESVCTPSFLLPIFCEFSMNQKGTPLQRQRADIGVILVTVWEDSANEAKICLQKEVETTHGIPRSHLLVSREQSSLIMRCLCMGCPETKVCIQVASCEKWM